jgi:hypothetical protein
MPWDCVAAAFILVCLTGMYRYEQNRCRRTRAGFFCRCLDLFDTYCVTQSDMAHPVLVGTYRGVEVRLEPIVDDMAWRKLPSLWLKTTIIKPHAYAGIFDLLIRPRGAEFYSPSGDLKHHLPLPAEWPRDALLCTDDPATMPPLGLLNKHIGVFDDPQMKELVITPRGVRLVRQIWQGKRAHYAVLRQVEFEEKMLDRDLLASLLESAFAISGDLSSRTRISKAA